MNDQFALNLRRHLLDSADERLADGQLEAVAQRVADEEQLRPWAARLRARLDVGPRRSLQLRYGLVAMVVLIAAAAAAALYIGSQARPGTVFEGRWTSHDDVDDSTQTLVVAAGQTPVVHLEDDYSIHCKNRGDTSTLYVADGPGEIDRGRLTARYTGGGCLIRIGPYEAFYDYDNATDTLVDYQETTWVRAPSD